MSANSTGLYGSHTIVNSDLFNDVESSCLKEQVIKTSLNTYKDKSCCCLLFVLTETKTMLITPF